MKKAVAPFASLSVTEYLVLFGVLMVAGGTALIFVPAGLIVGGLFVIGLSLMALSAPEPEIDPAHKDIEL